MEISKRFIKNKFTENFLLPLTILLVALSSTHIFYNYVFNVNLEQNIFPSDIPHHLVFAKQIKNGFLFLLPHPGFHFLIIFISIICFFSLEISTVITLSLAVMLTYILSYFILKKAFNFQRNEATLLSFFLFILTAIILLGFSKYLYLGQGNPNLWHNPTYILLKPIAILAFLLFILMIQNSHHFFKLKYKLIIATLLLISIGVKPSFAITFIPAALLFIIFFLKKEQYKFLINFLIIIIPSIFILALQYYLNFVLNGNKNTESISLNYLYVWHHFSPNPYISWFLGNLFPLFVIIFRFSTMKKEPAFVLTILFYLLAVFQATFLVETGVKEFYWNFSWAYNLALYFLYFISLVEYFKWIKENKNKNFKNLIPLLVTGIALLMHFLSGLYYFNKISLGFTFE